MDVKFIKGANKFERQMTDNRPTIEADDGNGGKTTVLNPQYGEKLFENDGKTPKMETISFSIDFILLQDGKSNLLLEADRSKAVYLFDEGKKRILIYSNGNPQREYNWDKDDFVPDCDTPEDLCNKLNNDYFRIS